MNWLINLLNIGKSDTSAEDQQQRLLITNAIVLFTMGILAILTCVYFLFGLSGRYFSLSFLVLVALTLFFQHRRWYLFAKVYLFLMLHTWILFRCISTGRESDIHFVFLAFIAVPFLIFGFEARWTSFLLSLLPTSLFFLVQYHPAFMEGTLQHLTPAQHMANALGSQFAVVVFYTVAFLVFDLGHQKYKNVFKQALTGAQTAGLAHELNNVVTSLSLSQRKMNKLIGMKDMPKEKIDAAVQEVDKITSQLSRILHSILSMARQNTGDTRSEVNVFQLVQDSLLMSQGKRTRASIEIRLESPEQQLFVIGHEGNLLQVLTNLIGNASDAILPLEEKWIHITWKTVNGMIQIRVTDSGKGIDPKIRKKIFAPLFTTKKQNQGTGLGLWLSREIIERHGGTLTLDEASANTCFVIELPAGGNT